MFLAGATLAVVMTGPPYGHYLVQIVPWFAISLGFALASARIATARWLLVAGMGVALIAAAVVHTRASYETLLTRIEQGQSLAYGPAYEIADYVRSAGQGPGSLYMMSDHLVYWLTRTYPPTRMSTHPSVLTKPEIIAAVEGADAAPDTELRKILATRPEFIVKPPVVDYLPAGPNSCACWTKRSRAITCSRPALPAARFTGASLMPGEGMPSASGRHSGARAQRGSAPLSAVIPGPERSEGARNP